MQNQTVVQVVESLKKASNVMVTVKNSPSVDELTAAISLTLILNHMNKHATTVFSGHIPSTIEFLQPEMAIETNTDSLRDFIISLDKNKADKLRYKVEDDFVKIYITPYKTSIDSSDLEFNQGDFNVDVVIALGVVNKEDFDQAISSHGRILHDATIVGVTKGEISSLVGTMNWHEPQASSVSEMIAGISDMMGPGVMDGQIATALMTGMVSETERFSNAKTTPRVLQLSSNLMAAGANQQLIAEKLDQPLQPEPIAHAILDEEPQINQREDGLLEIDHTDEIQKIVIDEDGNMNSQDREDSLLQEADTTEQQPPVGGAPGVGNHIDLAPPTATNGVLPDLGQGVNTSSQSDPQTDVPEPAPSPVLTNQDFIDTPPESMGQSANMPKIEDKPLKTGLFSRKTRSPQAGGNTVTPISNAPSGNTQNSELGIPDSNVDSSNSQTLPHREKVINPVSRPVEDATSAPAAPAQPQPKAPPVINHENSVVDIDGYTGSADSSLSDTEMTEEKMKQRQMIKQQVAKEKPVLKDEKPAAPVKEEKPKKKPLIQKKKKESKLPPAPAPTPSPSTPPSTPAPQVSTSPPPQVINPTSAPAVPPPIMPTPSDKPQFFEADGSRSNPFLNPQ